MKLVKRIISQEYHRNGSGMGQGFVVTLFESTDSGTMVATSFNTRQDFKTRQEAVDDFMTHTAVLSIGGLTEGNISYGNRWDGPAFGKAIAEAWAARGLADAIYPYDPFSEFTPADL